MTVTAPAKVNLGLSVGPLRPDGYHEIATVFHALSLHDTITVDHASEPSVTMDMRVLGVVPQDADNIALSAVNALAVRTGHQPHASVHIVKRIPVAAGLAGGSADAAGVLVACNELWQTGLPLAELADIAAGLGSDVAFALQGGTMVGTGRGERLAPVLAAPSAPLHWVIAASGAGLSTPAVYRALDEMRDETGQHVEEPAVSMELMLALRAGDVRQIAAALTNDLQPAALRLRPALARTLQAGLDAGAVGAIVSGSGPSCAFLAADAEHSVDLAVELSSAGVCDTVLRATGPAHGVQVQSVQSL
ncbi:MAG: 4-(cytidine 5'-diphospho)-2-C-methyl-D-erythritol kinase [Actinomycetales bacterium]|nr:4-(cytidine 5'-diphospho)-2-C-methyl-D-erythritol kinase [Actinomycetales bacterium]